MSKICTISHTEFFKLYATFSAHFCNLNLPLQGSAVQHYLQSMVTQSQWWSHTTWQVSSSASFSFSEFFPINRFGIRSVALARETRAAPILVLQLRVSEFNREVGGQCPKSIDHTHKMCTGEQQTVSRFRCLESGWALGFTKPRCCR